MSKYRYREVKNYIHNELKLTKEDIREIMIPIIREEVKRVFHDPPFQKGTVDAQPSKQSIKAPTAHIRGRASKARAKFKKEPCPSPARMHRSPCAMPFPLQADM